MVMAVEPQLSFGELSQIVQTIAVIGGGGIILVKMGRMMGMFEQIGTQQAEEISEIKGELKDLGKLLTTVAVQKNEINNLRDQVVMMQRQMDDMRHGEGFVLPISPKPTGV